MEKQERPYPLKYGVLIGEHHRDPDDERTWTVADAIVYIPIVRKEAANPYCGEKDLYCFSVDGHEKEPITDHELFQVFIFLAKTLSESAVLEPWQFQVIDNCLGVIEQIKKLVGKHDEKGKIIGVENVREEIETKEESNPEEKEQTKETNTN